MRALDPEARLRKLFDLRDRIDTEILALTKTPRQRRSRKVIPPCGTETGYQRHRYHNETCERCKRAHAAHQRAKSMKRKAS